MEVRTSDDAVSVREAKAATPLYLARIKVYPRAIAGKWRRIKWAALTGLLGLYYATPWLRWDRGPEAPSQAILIDLDGRRGWFFDVIFWPQEIYFVTGLLILAAFGLFFATALFGRVWCGFSCPQTVWTDLFMWVERLIEGDRSARIRLDRSPLSLDKAMRKALKHVSWVAIAAMTGGAWVFYYVDAPSTLAKIFSGQASTEVYFFVGLLTATTYLLAGWAREQVCTYMCPWPRFQAAMLDEHSVIVTYQKWRGEPRGKYKADDDPARRGDCIDCKLCVAVCPTGIDIRDGQQIECIGCGLCVDACNQAMDRVGRPRDLILWDTLASQQTKERAGNPPPWMLLRARTMLYGALLAAGTVLMIVTFWLRSDIELTIQRDRNPNFVRLSNGDIRNSYTVKALNKKREPQLFELNVEGLTNVTVGLQTGDRPGGAVGARLTASANSVSSYRVFLTISADSAPSGSQSIDFLLKDESGRTRTSHGAVFVGPGR